MFQILAPALAGLAFGYFLENLALAKFLATFPDLARFVDYSQQKVMKLVLA